MAVFACLFLAVALGIARGVGVFSFPVLLLVGIALVLFSCVYVSYVELKRRTPR
jgi:hypothetical protein